MELRRAVVCEYDAIGRLTVAAYEPFLRGDQDDYRGRLADVARRDREAEVWVAAAGDDPLGGVTLCPVGSPWREIATDDEGEFRMLAVSPVAQGRGVGNALAAMAIERCRTEGARAVVLSSLVDMAGAHRVYERLGFRRLPSRDWSPHPGTDLIAYELEL